MKQFLFFLIGLCFGMCTPATSQAQFNMPGLGLEQTGQLSITLSPQLPGPHETVTASVDDYALSLGGTKIEWIIDNTPRPEFLNNRSISFTTPEVGQTMNIALRLTTPTGEVINARHTIRPLYTDIIIEPFTYAPFTFPGRPLPSFGSRVLLTALVHDANGPVDAGAHSYTWSLNGRIIGGGSVRGGFRTEVVVPHGRNFTIGLSVTNPQGQLIARRLVSIPSVPVDIQLYELSPLFGLSYRAISGVLPLFGNSTTIRAVPYNLDRFVQDGRLFSEWQIDGRRQPANMADPFEITLSRSGFGSSEIRFRLRHRDALLQGGEARVLIQY